MPVNQSLMRSLKSRYGAEEGERIYYAMEQEGHKATKKKAAKKSRRRSSGGSDGSSIRQAMEG